MSLGGRVFIQIMCSIPFLLYLCNLRYWFLLTMLDRRYTLDILFVLSIAFKDRTSRIDQAFEPHLNLFNM